MMPDLPRDSFGPILSCAPDAASFQNLRCASKELARLSDVNALKGTKEWLRWRNLISKGKAVLQHTSAVNCCAFSPDDGARVVTASSDRTARIWDAETGAQLLMLKGHTAPVLSCAFSPDDGARVVTASDDGEARIWDAETGATLQTLEEHTDFIRSCAFSPDGGTRVVTASDDRTARIWNSAAAP